MFIGKPRAPKKKSYVSCSNWDCKCHGCSKSLRHGGLCTNCGGCCRGESSPKTSCKDYKK